MAKANGQRTTTWRCPRCGEEITLYVTATEVRCGCGARMRPDGGRVREEVEVATGAPR